MNFLIGCKNISADCVDSRLKDYFGSIDLAAMTLQDHYDLAVYAHRNVWAEGENPVWGAVQSLEYIEKIAEIGGLPISFIQKYGEDNIADTMKAITATVIRIFFNKTLWRSEQAALNVNVSDFKSAKLGDSLSRPVGYYNSGYSIAYPWFD